MPKNKTPQIRLESKTTVFISKESDAEQEAGGKVLVMPANVWRQIVALAEAADRQFRAPRLEYLPAQSKRLIKGVRSALNAKPGTPAVARGKGHAYTAHPTVLDQLSEFFSTSPANRKWLSRLVSFVGDGVRFEVSPVE